MATSSEQWDARRAKREEMRAKKKARQKKMLIILAAAVAVLLVVIALIVFLPSKKDETPDAPPAADVQQTETPEEQPEGTEAPAEKENPNIKTIRIAAAGDVNITDKVIASGGLNYDYTATFMEVAHLLADADLTVVNFEGNICGAPYGTKTASAPQGLVDSLDAAGVDLVQLANSYSINKGISGLKQTINGIRAAGMEPLGVYEDEADFKENKGYTICTVDGIKIAFVAFTKGMDGMALPENSENCVNLLYTDYESSYQQINRDGITAILDAAAKENPDITVAMLHWGSEYNDTVSPSQEKIVKLLQEKGVDAVIGTHPHYVQKMEFDPEEGTFVAYSLGDLISDGERSGTQYSVILNLEITKDMRSGKAQISDFYYVPIYTVAEKDEPLRVVRIAESLFAYECYFLGRVTEPTYLDMQYALERIRARVAGE